MATADQSVVLKKGEGTALWVLGGLAEVKATGDDTDGALTAIEWTVGPGWAAPPHTHEFGEAAYVLEGSLRFHIGDRTVDADAGSFLFFPKGTAEWYENVTESPARALLMYTQSGMEDFFAEIGEPAESRTLPPAPAPPTDAQIEALTAAAKSRGTDILPPPE